MEINVVAGTNWTKRDLEILFPGEPVQKAYGFDLPGLLKVLGVYPSTSAARRAGRTGPIPPGYTELKASKKVMLYIWNPTE